MKNRKFWKARKDVLSVICKDILNILFCEDRLIMAKTKENRSLGYHWEEYLLLKPCKLDGQWSLFMQKYSYLQLSAVC